MQGLNQPFTFDAFFNHLRATEKNYSVFSFFEEVFETLTQNEQYGSRDSYRGVLNRIKEFRKGKDLSILDLTYHFLEDFVGYYKREKPSGGHYGDLSSGNQGSLQPGHSRRNY